jgi:hypothetical protein
MYTSLAYGVRKRNTDNEVKETRGSLKIISVTVSQSRIEGFREYTSFVGYF